MTSEEVQRAARISGCDLMHLRVEGKLRFEKRGNAYLYHKAEVERMMQSANP
jgi:hypothetical protein